MLVRVSHHLLQLQLPPNQLGTCVRTESTHKNFQRCALWETGWPALLIMHANKNHGHKGWELQYPWESLPVQKFRETDACKSLNAPQTHLGTCAGPHGHRGARRNLGAPNAESKFLLAAFGCDPYQWRRHSHREVVCSPFLPLPTQIRAILSIISFIFSSPLSLEGHRAALPPVPGSQREAPGSDARNAGSLLPGMELKSPSPSPPTLLLAPSPPGSHGSPPAAPAQHGPTCASCGWRGAASPRPHRGSGITGTLLASFSMEKRPELGKGADGLSYSSGSSHGSSGRRRGLAAGTRGAQRRLLEIRASPSGFAQRCRLRQLLRVTSALGCYNNGSSYSAPTPHLLLLHRISSPLRCPSEEPHSARRCRGSLRTGAGIWCKVCERV